ncbi:TLC domain-containing protein 3A isoform X2 [Cylas formicarius]|uniref:TLC domain-containing protein 3A isoform X2 n=1 Tax=Cylas formicarius TaxID=197179 RepID=UPI0029587230|nr:TLC domain-containing protein 3A isoform X2 [Cylas formicarius]
MKAKKAAIIYPLVFLILSSLAVSYFTLRDLEWEEHVSIQRGFWLFSSGLLFFTSLYLVINNALIHTHSGRKMMRACKLSNSCVYDISNKCVSAVQALFCCLTGLTSTTYSCSRDMLQTSHYISEAYAWFGAAYFAYDIWSMYKVWSSKVTQPDMTGVSNKLILKTCRLTAYIANNFMIVAHHIFIGAFGFLVITYLRGGLGDCFFGYIYLMEASTPFVSLRGIISKIGLKESRWYVANGLVMLATFFVFRVAMFPYVISLYAKSIQADFLTAVKKLPRNCLVSIGILMIPQVYWFLLMVKGATQILMKKNSASSSNNNNLRKKSR